MFIAISNNLLTEGIYEIADMYFMYELSVAVRAVALKRHFIASVQTLQCEFMTYRHGGMATYTLNIGHL